MIHHTAMVRVVMALGAFGALVAGTHALPPSSRLPGPASPARAGSTTCPDLPADAAIALDRGVALEDSPVGHCLAEAALHGNAQSALRIADTYHARSHVAPLLDVRGREIRWYHLAADLGSSRAAARLAELLDKDIEWQMPDIALSYAMTALRAGDPDAGDQIVQAWQDGRIAPEKLYGLRQWLDDPKAPAPALRQAVMAGLNATPDELEPA